MDFYEHNESIQDDTEWTAELEEARQEVYDALALGEKEIAEGKGIEFNIAMKEILVALREHK
ncbi:MAG: hypothetical protein HUJ85_00150 [Veillonella sp.]|nr:hypothetical protein [Veillonella sp.]